MMKESSPYIPALSFHWLTPLYDPVLKWGVQEERFKQQLITQTAVAPHMQVLDLGCGTGTLTILLAQCAPEVKLHGLDGDAVVLARAATKAEHSGVDITSTQGFSFALPYRENTFHRVTASLMLHHLNREQKHRTLREVRRVLRPGGELHIVDFGPPHAPLTQWMSRIVRHLEETADHLDGLLPRFLMENGFVDVVETTHLTSVVGPLSLYQAAKPLR